MLQKLRFKISMMEPKATSETNKRKQAEVSLVKRNENDLFIIE